MSPSYVLVIPGKTVHLAKRLAQPFSKRNLLHASSGRSKTARRHPGRPALDLLLPSHLRHAPVAGRRGRIFPGRADGNFRPHD